MGLFHKKNDKAQIKDALKELNENLANVHASVARVRAEEARLRVKLQNVENDLADQQRYLARAKAEGRPTESYEAKIAEMQKNVDQLKEARDQAVANLEHVEALERDLAAQKDQIAYLKKEQESLLDDAYYYAETVDDASAKAPAEGEETDTLQSEVATEE